MKTFYLAVVGLALALAVPACLTSSYGGRSGAVLSANFGVGVTSVRPPAPYRENYGYPPRHGYFWVPGVWVWDGWRYTWRQGYWEAPRPGYRYQPHIWKQDGRNWHLQGGEWQRYR